MPSMQSVQDYLASVEEYFHWSISAVTHGLPDVHEAVNQLWVDISRYGPGLPAFPDVHIPVLGDFQVPPPPPPPPPAPASFISAGADWLSKHPRKTAGVAVCVMGLGLFAGYRHIDAKRRRSSRHRAHVQVSSSKERNQIVLVLGGDTPYGLSLVRDLESKGYIVIASVSTPEAVEALETQCEGYVRAHILDPYEPATVPAFLRSLSQTLTRRFPINAPGDPYASSTTTLYIQSIISLLTLSPPSPTVPAPLEHVSFADSYLPYLNATQITPLQVIQALLPILRSGSIRSKDRGQKTIVICLPATDVRVGLPFSGVRAMSAAGTLRAAQVLRREISIASLTDKTDSMRNIKVVIVDVGDFKVPGSSSSSMTNEQWAPEALYQATRGWTDSEKVTYGPAFAAAMQPKVEPDSLWRRFRAVFKEGHHYGLARKQVDINVFTNNLVGVVSGGRLGSTFCGIGVVRNWLRGDRFSMGAGARTYAAASHLPSVLLDGLLNLPHWLIALRNRLLPTQPYRRLPGDDLPRPQHAQLPSGSHADRGYPIPSTGATTPEIESSSVSDADEESNAGDAVDSSWVSLGQREHAREEV